jgi:nitrogen regulatory protein P-II 1
MRFKLIMALVKPERTDDVVLAMREAGATGDTIIRARGSGLHLAKTFFGLNIEGQSEIILVLAEESMVASLLETVKKVVPFEDPGNGIAFVIPVDQVLGLDSQIKKLKDQAKESYF